MNCPHRKGRQSREMIVKSKCSNLNEKGEMIGRSVMRWIEHMGIDMTYSPESQFSSVQLLSHVQLFVTPWTAARQADLPVHQLLELAQTNVQVSDAIQPSHPPSSPFLRTFNLSQHQGFFKWVSYLHQVAKVLEFWLQLQSFQWISGLISFRIDWLDLIAVQGTLKSLLQHHNSKASLLQHSAFFIVQLSHPYMTTGQNLSFD